MATNNKRSRKWELRIVGYLCMLISLLHLFGFLEWEMLVDRIPIITLLAVGLFITLLTNVLEKVGSEEDINRLWTNVNNTSNDILNYQLATLRNQTSIKESLDEMVSNCSPQGIEISKFNNVGDVYDYISVKISLARHEIKDITWGSYTGYRTEHEQKCYENYVKTIESVCQKGTVTYEEISSLSDEHYFNRSIRLTDYYSYHLAYHDISCIDVPLISYVIIDTSEVVLGFYRVPGVVKPADDIVYLCIKNELLVKFYLGYYKSIWDKAIKLKDAAIVDHNKIAEIKQKLHI